MNARIYFNTLIVAMLLCLAASGSAQEAEVEIAALSVTSKPAGYRVYLDGEFIGFSPLQNFVILPGEHTVVIRPHALPSWVIPDWQQVIQAAPGDTLRLAARFKRAFLIQSVPFPAHAYLNGKLLGDTPLYVALDCDEKATVTLKKDGYLDAYALCDPSGNTRIDVTLQSVATFWKKQKIKDQDISLHKRKYRRYTFISAAASVVAGVTTVLFRKEADRAYQNYLQATDPQQMDRYFSDAQRYDTYSSVAFGLFQASFAVGFYFFLRSSTQ